MVIAAAAAALIGTSCTGPHIVNTDEPAPTVATAASTTPPLPPSNRLVNAFDFVAHVDGRARYYFTTPSGDWDCAIVPRESAGCQSAQRWPSGLDVADAPDTVPDASGDTAAPNTILVGSEGKAHFAALEEPRFRKDQQPAKTLQYNQILAAAGFRCNVQESGVSCMSELTGNGFTFSADGHELRYTEVPADAPA